MIVWGDLLFLINFSMDFLCFYICCRLRHERLPTGRGALAALLGGVYSVASLFILTERWLAFALDIAVLFVMCLCVWGEKRMSFWRFLRSCGLYFFVSALLGGFMTALFSLFNRLELFVGEIGIGDGVDVWIFSALALISCVLALKGGRIFRSSAMKGTATLEIESEFGSVRLRALIDSGNGATEPMSGRSVIFVRLDAIERILDGESYFALLNYTSEREIPASLATRVRFVPVKTVSGDALLPALRFKKIRLIMKEKTKEIDAYIAPTANADLSGHDAIISHEATIL